MHQSKIKGQRRKGRYVLSLGVAMTTVALAQTSNQPTGANPAGSPSGGSQTGGNQPGQAQPASPMGSPSGSPTGSPSGSPTGSPSGSPTGSPTEGRATEGSQLESSRGRGTQHDTQPDNTKRNAEEQQLTAEDQGGSAEDREMTRNIRRELVKSDELSMMSKNIKIITSEGKVTLKGPVDSEQEKARIQAIAEKAVGKGKVTDQLEIKKR